MAIFLIGLGQVPAGDKPAVSSGEIQFALDYCVFNAQPDGTIYVEFYIMIYAQGLHAEEREAKTIGLARIDTKIFNAQNALAKEQNWLLEAVLPDDPVKLKMMAVYDQWAEFLPSGQYRCRLEILDQVSGSRGETEMNFHVPVPSQSGVTASQIEFVSKIAAKTADSPFIKGNRLVYPNPERRYGVLNPNLMIYYELYGLKEDTQDKIDIFYQVRDQKDSIVQVFPTGGVNRAGSSVAVTHGFDVSTIPSGVYSLYVNLRDGSGRINQLQSRRFEILQLEHLSQKTFITAEEAKIAGNQIRYFATPQEYRIYEDLELNEKAKFLVYFWKEKDPDPETPLNEFFVRVQQRYQYANDKFGWLDTEGWQTDRGRVLIMNGMPDNIIRNQFEEQTIAHEIWQYDQPRRYEYVFADYRSTGHYILIHSNREGEIHDENWRSTIKR